jgi:hypothetical protein
VAIGALAYFIRSQITDLKDAIKILSDKVECVPDRYVERDDCRMHIGECTDRIKERRVECNRSIEALREVTSSLVTCVNRHVDSCEVKNK